MGIISGKQAREILKDEKKITRHATLYQSLEKQEQQQNYLIFRNCISWICSNWNTAVAKLYIRDCTKS